MVIYNGKHFDDNSPVIKNNDHSYRYGDGLFETMKVIEGRILYKEYHFERLFSGLKILRFTLPFLFTKEKIESEIIDLCFKNNCAAMAKVRLSVSRGGGGLFDCDNSFSYLIECGQTNQANQNETGLVIDVFPDARKSIDAFSNLKSANYLPYVMAAVWAKENNLDDALLLNSNRRICDATIANVFWVKDNRTFTVPLSEGCIDGVMRRKILEVDKTAIQKELTEEILLVADEVFLTNVISGVRWVAKFRQKEYSNKIARKLFAEIAQTIPT